MADCDVIVIDLSEDEDVECDPEKKNTTNDDSDSDIEIIEDTPNKNGSDDSLDIAELLKLLDQPTMCPICFRFNIPVDCVPKGNIRKFYGVQLDESQKICKQCNHDYEEEKIYSSSVPKSSLENSDIIYLDDDSDEEELIKNPLLLNAIKDSVKQSLKRLNVISINEQALKDQCYPKLERLTAELKEEFATFKKAFQEKQDVIMLPEVKIPDVEILSESETEQQFENPEELKIGDTVYGMRESTFSEWILYTIVSISKNVCKEGQLVDIFSLQSNIDNNVTGVLSICDNIAHRFPSKNVEIGSRVIGAVNWTGGKKFFSGMIAEVPNSENKFRYLVFFNNGKERYCTHEDIRLIYKTNKLSHHYFSGPMVEHVKYYMENFPTINRVNASVGQMIRLNVNDHWVNAIVEKIDCNLYLLKIGGNSPRQEWVYNGSPKLRLTDEITPKQDGAAVRNHYTGRSIFKNQLRPRARKSTIQMPQPDQAAPEIEITEKRITRSSSVNSKSLTRKPRIYRSHTCNSNCITSTNHDKNALNDLSPLMIPSMFVFSREIPNSSNSVIYIAPCGKKLKNLQAVLDYLTATQLPLTLNMFDFNSKTNIFDQYVVSPNYVTVGDITLGGEKHPIACVNECDSSCTDLMSYLVERRPLEGVNINSDPGFLVCCDCEGNCRDRQNCACWNLTVNNYEPFQQYFPIDRSQIGYQYQRLYDNVLTGVYECNSQCKCNQTTCINRVAQHPMPHKLQLFRTPKKGWGTRTLNDIPKGVFVSTYIGLLMTEKSANEAGEICGDEYFAELDHIEVLEELKAEYEANAALMTDEEDEPTNVPAKKQKRTTKSIEEVFTKSSQSVRKLYGPDEDVYVMDAKIAGNIGRYFNHSCDPNLFVQNVYVDTHDLRFPWIAFFAKKHIPAGTELTWEYGYVINSVPGKVLICHCGSSKCRRRLL